MTAYGRRTVFFGNQFHYPLHGEKARFGPEGSPERAGGAWNCGVRAGLRVSACRCCEAHVHICVHSHWYTYECMYVHTYTGMYTFTCTFV